MRVGIDGVWAAFAPEGLASATAQVTGNAVRYANVQPGVDLLYEAGHDAVKESFILAGPAAPSAFSFRMRSSPGLRAARRGRGLDVGDATGKAQLRLNPPELIDAAGGLYKFGTRYYDPSIGRWTQQDPLPGSIGDPAQLNRYVYVGDNPVNFVDPSEYCVLGLFGRCDNPVNRVLTDPNTYLGQATGTLFGGAVGATCAAFVIGFTGGIGTPGSVACAVVGRGAGQWAAYQVRAK